MPRPLSEEERIVWDKLVECPGLSDRQLKQRLRGKLSAHDVWQAWLALDRLGIVQVQHQPYKRRLLLRLYPISGHEDLVFSHIDGPRARTSALAEQPA